MNRTPHNKRLSWLELAAWPMPAWTADGRVHLLFGPYKAPLLKRGDRATCLYRDGLVVVTSWTDAPIPWPRCRALNSHGGGSGLLVEEELARAIRHESAAPVMHCWGTSTTAVWHWRKALGVGRTDNEGSRRLIRAASETGADLQRGKPLPAEAVERRRQTAVEPNLGRYLIPGYHGALWLPEDIALLGTVSDEDVARRTDRTPNAVRVMRDRLGLPRFSCGQWRADEVAFLGTLPDREVAQRLGRSLAAVTQKRCRLGIPNACDLRRKRT